MIERRKTTVRGSMARLFSVLALCFVTLSCAVCATTDPPDSDSGSGPPTDGGGGETDAGLPPPSDSGGGTTTDGGGPPGDSGTQPPGDSGTLPAGEGDPCAPEACPDTADYICVGPDEDHAYCRLSCVPGTTPDPCPTWERVCAELTGGGGACMVAYGEGHECAPEFCGDGFVCIGPDADNAYCCIVCDPEASPDPCPAPTHCASLTVVEPGDPPGACIP